MEIRVAEKAGNSDRAHHGDVSRRSRDDLSVIVTAGEGVERQPSRTSATRRSPIARCRTDVRRPGRDGPSHRGSPPVSQHVPGEQPSDLWDLSVAAMRPTIYQNASAARGATAQVSSRMTGAGRYCSSDQLPQCRQPQPFDASVQCHHPCLQDAARTIGGTIRCVIAQTTADLKLIVVEQTVDRRNGGLRSRRSPAPTRASSSVAQPNQTSPAHAIRESSAPRRSS